MTMWIKRLAQAGCGVFGLFAVAACASDDAPAAKVDGDDGDHGAFVDAGDKVCPVLESADWRAWVNRMPTVGEAKPKLVVEGVVTLPTPGYAAEWRLGPTDRAMPPGQMLAVSFARPTGIVAQVLTPTPVRFETPAVADAYRRVTVICGGETLATIEPVMTAQ